MNRGGSLMKALGQGKWIEGSLKGLGYCKTGRGIITGSEH